MNITCTDADFQSLEHFALAWRWTDARWNVLPLTVLANICPLTPAKANEVWQMSRGIDRSLDQLPRSSADLAFLDAACDNDEAVRVWLRHYGMPQTETILVLWDSTTAVRTTWNIFCTYWDDFCYPSSDDVFVWSLSRKWFAAYAHYETFVVGRTG
jgi:hypothetical protein